MSVISEFANIWGTVKEIDLRPIRSEAERGVQITIVGRKGTGKRRLAERMRHDLWREQVSSLTPVHILDLESKDKTSEVSSDLMIMLVPGSTHSVGTERQYQQEWLEAGKKVLVVINTQPATEKGSQTGIANGQSRQTTQAIPEKPIIAVNPGWLAGDINNPFFLRNQFIPTVIGYLPDKLLALGRGFPLFRVAISHQLINETCFTNASYAFSTGLAEIVPVLDIPLNVADMFILSKNQAFLVYRLGLTLGFSTNWQDYLKEFGGVLGGGFIWRQVARQLVGLIPGWGIVPKVAVSYAGTYVVGQAILQWYLTGRHITRQQIAEFYRQAFLQGKQVGVKLLKRKPAIAQSKPKALPAGKQKRYTCPACGKKISRKAQFCQYCGTPLALRGEINASKA
jgi:uncharacterized protein (DUF697 family)/predicted RNA-binding Zn-ribbon protein involved in translation (DUF1610 family)